MAAPRQCGGSICSTSSAQREVTKHEASGAPTPELNALCQRLGLGLHVDPRSWRAEAQERIIAPGTSIHAIGQAQVDGKTVWLKMPVAVRTRRSAASKTAYTASATSWIRRRRAMFDGGVVRSPLLRMPEYHGKRDSTQTPGESWAYTVLPQ